MKVIWEVAKDVLYSWRCVKTNSFRVIMGDKGEIIHTEKNTCDCPSCIAMMERISKEQIG